MSNRAVAGKDYRRETVDKTNNVTRRPTLCFIIFVVTQQGGALKEWQRQSDLKGR